jgi:acyl-CoA thioesterase
MGEISAAAQRMWDDDAASGKLGMQLHVAVDGRARLSMTVTDEMVNGHGMCHGGYLFLLADSAFACACNSPGPVAVAAAADIVFVASARTGEVLEAVATERVAFGRSGVFDVTVARPRDGQVIAEFRGRSRTLRRD